MENSQDQNCGDFGVSSAEKKRKKINRTFELSKKYFGKFLEEDNLWQCVVCTNEAPVTESLTDQEIISIVFNQQDLHSDTEFDEEEIEITHEEALAVGFKYLEFLHKANYISKQEIMTVQRLKQQQKKRLLITNQSSNKLRLMYQYLKFKFQVIYILYLL